MNTTLKSIVASALSIRCKKASLIRLGHFYKNNITTLPMPSLSPTMTSGTIVEWKQKVGDELRPGDILCDIETDKASVGFEMQDNGVLAKILIDAKQEVACGQPIAIIVDDLSEYEAFLKEPSAYITDSKITTDASSSNSISSKEHVSGSSNRNSTVRRLSPAARHLIDSKSLDISRITGTSKDGIISKGDLINGIKNGLILIGGVAKRATATPSSATSSSVNTNTCTTASISLPVTITNNTPANTHFKDTPNSNIRKVIAKRLTESKATVPHFYTSIECEIDELLELRKVLKKDLDVVVSVNDIVIKSAALALRDVQVANAKYDNKTQSINSSDKVDISVAVATPNGLITPIVYGSDKRGVSEISTAVKDLASRARDGKLKPEEYQGGSFSISNLGMFGISSFSAVINPPQACILAVGSGIQRILPPKVNGKKPRVATSVAVQLSCDRRVVDEATAALFLQNFAGYLSQPKNMVL